MKYNDVEIGDIVMFYDDKYNTFDIVVKEDEMIITRFFIGNQYLINRDYSIYTLISIMCADLYKIEDFKQLNIYKENKEMVDELINEFFVDEQNKVNIRKYKLKLLENVL